MSKATVAFQKCHLSSQDYGSDDEHMVSRVFFTLQLNGGDPIPLYADLRQTIGSDYETAPLEVSWPKDYEGPLSYHKFRDEVEAYYRSLVGSQGSAIRLEGAHDVMLIGNVFEKEKIVQFEVDTASNPW